MLDCKPDGKPFVLLGVHADDQDARKGPISNTYNINAWPTIYVLDRNGVIRYRDPYHRDMAAAVDKLLPE
jgi:hypothetical protein